MFTLIVSTVGRYKELETLLESFKNQSYKKFDVIIVDQNPNGFLSPIVSKYSDWLSITHLYSERGLSLGRNVGLRHARGKYVAFPDDDCWYAPDALESVLDVLKSEDVIGASSSVIQENGESSMGRWPQERMYVSRTNIFQTVISFTVFVDRKIANSSSGFNEELGVGSGTKWGSGEETDFVLRCLEKGKILYFPSKLFYHPEKVNYNKSDLIRGLAYATGFGRVLKLHNYSFFEYYPYLLRPLAAVLFFLIQGKFIRARFYISTLQGRLIGLFSK